MLVEGFSPLSSPTGVDQLGSLMLSRRTVRLQSSSCAARVTALMVSARLSPGSFSQALSRDSSPVFRRHAAVLTSTPAQAHSLTHRKRPSARRLMGAYGLGSGWVDDYRTFWVNPGDAWEERLREESDQALPPCWTDTVPIPGLPWPDLPQRSTARQARSAQGADDSSEFQDSAQYTRPIAPRLVSIVEPQTMI